MKKINSYHPLANTYIYMYIAAATLVYVLTLFIQLMTYDKEAKTIAGHDYVREVTRWPGHVRVLNIPVEYAQEQYYMQSMHIILFKCLKQNIMQSDTTIENLEGSCLYTLDVEQSSCA